MVRKLFYLLLFCAVFVPIGSAQTIQWLVKPNYDNISYLNGSVFKCKVGNHVQLVNIKGRELLTPAADSVTNYSENLALVLDKFDTKLKIRGIIDESGIFTLVNEELFVNKYSYYSEGLISVVNASGKAGYLDGKGNLVIPCQYRIARPFIKGWASVEPAKRQKQTIYIDHQRQTLKISDFHNGKVVMGSSFNSSGEALVAYYDNDNAVINTSGKVIRKYNRTEHFTPIRPYDFAFDESGKKHVPVSSPEISFDTEFSPFSSGQLMGYKKADIVVVPPQFSQAGQFANGCAIVCQNDKYGIVKLAEGSFSGTFEGEDLLVTEGKQAPTYTYTLVTPGSLNPNALEVMFDIGDGQMQTVNLKNNRYEFTPFVDDNANVCVMKMQVLSDGLLLWTDSLEKNVTNVSLDISLPIALSERANEQDELRIQSVITNNSDLPVLVSGFFYANFAKDSKNKFGQKKTFWHKVAPKCQYEVFTDMIVVEEENLKVFVSVKANKKTFDTKSAVIQLKPFY